MLIRIGAVVCSALLSLATFAQTVVSRSGVPLDAAPNPTSAAIIEFREPLRVAANGDRSAAVESRRRTLQADLDDLADHPRVRRVYAHAFSGAAVTISPDAWDDVAKLPYVKRVYPDQPVHAFLSQSVPQIGAPLVWASHGTRGSGVVVAVIDTGVDYRHPALGGGMGAGFRVTRGWDFVNDDADPTDDNGHGTHVAGIVGANSATLTGVAPDVSFLAYKVLDAGGRGEMSEVIAAIDRALDPDGNGDTSDAADVINLSLGGPGTPDDPVSKAVENAIAHGVVVVAAVGNAWDYFTIGSPACAPNAISVGASELSGSIAFFSSKGPNTQSYSIKPEVVAPGVNIVSAAPGGSTRAMSGTSMAAPHVAGAAALLLAVHPDWTPSDVKSALVSTAVDLHAEAMEQGAGRIDIAAAAASTIFLNPATLSFGLANVETNLWSPSQQVRITNRGASAVTLANPVPGSAAVAIPQGWAITSAGTTLAPGASIDVTLSMTVDHSASLYPTAGSLSYGGFVTLAGARMPWAFVKASRIRVQVDEGTPTAFVSDDHQRYRVIPSGPNVAESILPAGMYDVVTWIAHPGEGRLAVRENVEVKGTANIDIATSSLQHTITPAGVDEKGVRLSSQIRSADLIAYQTRLRLVYPEANLNNYFDSAFLDVSKFRMNDIPPTWQVLIGEFYENAELNTSYAVQHTPLVGVSASATLTAPALREQAVRVVVPQESDLHRVGLANSKHDRYPGRRLVESWSHVFSNVAGKQWTGRVFMTADVHPTYGFSPAIGMRGTEGVLDDFEATPLRLFSDGRSAVVSGVTAGPATQWHQSGTTATFGGAPIHPEMEFIAISPTQLHANFFFYGPNRERRWRDIYSTRWAAFNGAGQNVGSGSLDSSNLLVTIPAAGALRLEITNDRSQVAGRPALATYRSWTDTTRFDSTPPSFSALSVQNAAGDQLDVVPVGTDAWLLFGLVDWHGDSDKREHKAIRTDATRVEYRVSGSTTWIAAEPQFVVQDLLAYSADRKSDGAVYRCRIPATNGASTMDVRITGEDAEGNRVEYTLEPAFAVSGAAPDTDRRRAVRH
ncbi:MAG TPA: S8 family serine peptidase [Thermoanaerobaculia bacterium]